MTLHGDRSVTFLSEVADSTVKRMKGLMFRDELAPDRGMLFVFKQPEKKSFWMRYTRIPLDIIFIDQDKRIVNIREAEPCRSTPCPRYPSRGRVRYVLEINRGLSDTYGFRPGTSVDFSLP